jgi:hypothetical protein
VSPESTIGVLRDALGVYDHRFLTLDEVQRDRVVEDTRRLLGEEPLDDRTRAALPASFRLRAFCVQRGLRAELERLISDEAAGVPGGAVVVGGRVYALYPYLRGVSRQDADITAEVGVEHRLDAVGWRGRGLRVRGRAVVERIGARETDVELVLRDQDDQREHRFPGAARADGFEAYADLADAGPGRWEVHVTVTSLGLTREARLGAVRAAKVRTRPRQRTIDAGTQATLVFTGEDHLTVVVEDRRRRAPLRGLLRRR